MSVIDRAPWPVLVSDAGPWRGPIRRDWVERIGRGAEVILRRSRPSEAELRELYGK
jgi:hypothetical protein